MKIFIQLALLLSTAAYLSGCASTGPKSLNEALAPNLEQKSLVLNKVDYTFYKEGDKQCGPASLAMMIHPYQPEISLEQLQAMTFTKQADGSYKQDMLSAARRLGYATYAVPTVEQILVLSSQGKPVLIFHNLGLSWAPTWHYSVLVGFDAQTNSVFLHSGETAYQRMRFKKFKNTWQRGGKWSYIITPPQEVPTSATFDEALENAMVFETLKNNSAAQSVYETMSKRWPNRYEPYVGLANTYAKKDTSKAINALKVALEKQPSNPGIYYNLAYLYSTDNKPELAKQMKTRTLEVAPQDQRAFYEKKLAELQ